MARKKQERHFDLSIYLIKAGVTDHEVIVPSSPQLQASRVRSGRHTVGTLYVSYPPRGKLPRWTDFVRGGVPDEFLDALKVKTASGVLLVEQDDRVFAITFGHGHHLIENEQIVSNFGLKTTLNSVDPDAIRQVDRRKLDSTGRIAIEQSGIEIPIYQFGLDIEQDLVRRVTAKPRDPELGRQLSGKDALRVTAPLNLENLNDFLSKIYRISQETTYQENFAFIDNIAEIHEETLVLALQARVIELANDDGASGVWMAPPDIIDWNQTQGMRYTNNPDEDPRQDIDLVTFGAIAMGGEVITWDGFEHHRIYVIGNDDDELESWSARKCLYAEFEHDGHTYVLTGGKWYRINDDFASRIAQNFAAIPDCTLELPVWTQQNEGQYNDATAAASGGTLRLLDRKLIAFPPGRDRMEFCDLLSNQRHLIHVKQFSSSSGMSHLCAQAANSAEYLKMDGRFRELVNEKLTELEIPEAFHVPAQFTNANAAQYEVVFGIAGKHAHLPIEIPFFSKVSISHAARRCQGLGFQVSKLKIVKDNLAN